MVTKIEEVDSEIRKIEWDYSIPKDMVFIILPDPHCELCQNRESEGVTWLSKFLKCGVPYLTLMRILKDKFNVDTKEPALAEHKEHIRLSVNIDETIRTQARGELAVVESDLVYNIDEKKAIESSIRSLYTRKLQMERAGTLGRDYIEVCNQLRGWVELKLKLKKELPGDSAGKLILSDIIDVSGIYGKQRPDKNDKSGSRE